jgi:Histidine kinase-, DNA gyrase B-, and HSP90-like ATPase
MTSTIQAQVSQSTIGKVSRLFNASLTDCLNELLQNARRAGASAIEITLSANDHLTIADDGSGIADPQTLLTLGESNWSEETQQQESPAGMGVFSLAKRTVTIRSHDWQVHLTPAHFSGEAIAPVEFCDAIEGTRLSFFIKAIETSTFRSRVWQIAEFYPLPVWLNGEEIPRQDFLEKAVYVENLLGLRIGLRRKYSWRGRDSLNFYGLTLTQVLPSLRCNGDTWTARVDIVDCPQLKLVLPARKEVVQNAFWTMLETTLWRVLYRYVATLPHHDLSYSQWQKAKSLGVQLKDAEASLHCFTPAIADSADYGSFDVQLISNRSLLVQIDDLACSQQQVFWRAFQQAQLDYEPVTPDQGYAGYSWYDKLPRLSAVRFEIEQDGKVLEVESWCEEQFSIATDTLVLRSVGMNFKVDQVLALALITDSEKQSQEIRLACDVLFVEDSDQYWDEVGQIPIVLSQSAQLSVEELAMLLEDSYFSPSTDSDADSVYTQREDFCEMAYERSAKVLLSEQAALKERLAMAAERHLRWVVPSNQRLEIRMVPRLRGEPLVCVELSETE